MAAYHPEAEVRNQQLRMAANGQKRKSRKLDLTLISTAIAKAKPTNQGV